MSAARGPTRPNSDPRSTALSAPGLPRGLRRPSGGLRLFLRVPVWLHRLGLRGWERLIGQQWMLITTRGRRTGRPHAVMVDVVGHDAAADTYYAIAAYGARADWYQNIVVHPVVDVSVGTRRCRARATTLSAPEASARLLAFYRRRPRYTRAVLAMVGGRLRTESDLLALLPHLRLLAITPLRQEP